jgi:hypothetical protein
MGESELAAATAAARRVRASYDPPNFGHVTGPDVALFLCAVDHKSGYRRSHQVDGRGPFRGSELMWEVGLRVDRERGGWLRAATLDRVSGEEVADAFRIDDETVVDPDRRAALWRDLAAGLLRDYEGSAARLLAAAGGQLGGGTGLLARLSRFEAYSDPLAKKAQLLAKICERRGWFDVADPECWEVSADSVLMRVALRCGLVEPGPLDEVRAATRDAFAALATATGIPVPELDDMVWELGREDPDLLGNTAGDIREPPRDPESSWY